jgi:hypothetical protein
MTVEDSFQIGGRGLVVVPAPLVSEYEGPLKLSVKLLRPDGSELNAELHISHVFQTPPPKELRWGCVFPRLSKQEVPIGTEIWLINT